MDDFNPYQPPETVSNEPPAWKLRLNGRSFLPFVIGMWLMTSGACVNWFHHKVDERFPSLLVILSAIVTGAGFTAVLATPIYVWLRYRVGKYGIWQPRPVLLFVFGLVCLPSISLIIGGFIFSMFRILPAAVSELISVPIFLLSIPAYAELMKYVLNRPSR